MSDLNIPTIGPPIFWKLGTRPRGLISGNTKIGSCLQCFNSLYTPLGLAAGLGVVLARCHLTHLQIRPVQFLRRHPHLPAQKLPQSVTQGFVFVKYTFSYLTQQ